MNTIIRFPRSPKQQPTQTVRPVAGASIRVPAERQRTAPIRRLLIVISAAAAVPAAYAFNHTGGFDRLLVRVGFPIEDAQSATFSICGNGPRENCVVDGDTFWFAGTKIRLADIDAPELNPPRCEAEQSKGEAAKERLRDLLNAGRFTLIAGARDTDRYGRSLRTVTRQGRSIGEQLVAENLARRWNGPRHSWCDG